LTLAPHASIGEKSGEYSGETPSGVIISAVKIADGHHEIIVPGQLHRGLEDAVEHGSVGCGVKVGLQGLTDHVWTLQDVLRYRGPPWPQSQRG
jgi:hypothetical protein